MKRACITFAGVVAAATVLGQTPPVKPQTPDIVVPPPVVMPVPPTEAGAKPLTVDEAVALAQRYQQSIAIARANVEAASGRTQASEAPLHPQFGANAGVTRTENFRGQSSGGTGGGSSPNTFTAGLTLSQLLFDFGRTRNAVRQQRALEEANRFALSTEQQSVALDTRVAFFNFAQNLALVTSSEQNLANRQRQYNQAEARLNSGLGAPSDYVRAKAGLADAVLSLESARNAADNARITLAQQLGIDPRTPITPDTNSLAVVAAPAVTEINRLIEKALKERPEMREAQQRLIAAGLGVAVARLTNAPSVSLNGGLNNRGSNDPFANQSGSIGVSLSWNFGDGGLAAGRTREAKANEDAARANLQLIGQQVVADVTLAYSDLSGARQRVATATAQVANAEELLRISEGRYTGGIGTFLEVTDAQSTLYSAQRNLLQAQSDLQRANARLQRAIGAETLASR
jgi:adhesin transport system outer membrane protein